MLDALLEKRDDLRSLIDTDGLCGGQMRERQFQRMQREVDCFVAGIGGAVPIGKSGIGEPAFATARERANGGRCCGCVTAYQVR